MVDGAGQVSRDRKEPDFEETLLLVRFLEQVQIQTGMESADDGDPSGGGQDDRSSQRHA
jgi:hypothetical protein